MTIRALLISALGALPLLLTYFISALSAPHQVKTNGFFFGLFIVFMIVAVIASKKLSAKNYTGALLVLFTLRFLASGFFLLFLITSTPEIENLFAIYSMGSYFYYLILEGYWSFYCGKQIQLK